MTLKATNRSLSKRSSLSSTTSSSFAIHWLQLVATTLVIIAALINLTHGFKPITGEGRKLFGGYRITPKQCRATKTLPSSDPRAKGPTICMFNHECAQRNGEVVGACMDGFLFGACCQIPSNQKPENTLINDAQNSYYHHYQNQKLQQQEAETNKIVSQAYETFAENSVQQQSIENSQAQDSLYGSSSLSSTYNINHVNSHQQQTTSEQMNSISGSSTESLMSSMSAEMESTNTEAQTKPTQHNAPLKIQVQKDSVQISSPSQSPQSDDFVLQVLNTAPPAVKNHTSSVIFATELPNKIASSLSQQQSSSESSSFEEEPSQATSKPVIKKPEPTKKQQNKNQQTEQHDHSEAVQPNEQQLFGAGVTFTHSDITHPGADADLIEDDLQFSTGYGPQPVFVAAPPKPIQEINKVTSHLYDATTSSSSITTHVDSIETIIQQLNSNNSNPGPAYNIINHHEQQQHAQDQPENIKLSLPSPSSLPSLSYNEIDQNDDHSISLNNYGQTSSAATGGETTPINTVEYTDEFVLEDHTVPEVNYNDYQTNKHPTSDFNKMPAIGIAYPVDMSYMEEGANLEAEEQPAYLNTQHKIHQQHEQSSQAPQASYGAQSDEQSQQQQQISQASYGSSQNDGDKFIESQTEQNYMAEAHQRPIASYIGVVTSQSYNTQPLPNEVVVSSHTTKVMENAEVSTEYKPIITTNRITATSHRTTTKPVKITPFTKRPTLVTKRPNNQKPTKSSQQQRPTTVTYGSTNKITTQNYYSATPIETKTPLPAEPLYTKPTVASTQSQIIQQQNYIISSDSTRKPTKKQTAKPASTSYITGPTTPQPGVTPQFHYDEQVSVIQADDKLDSFVHSTAENLGSATPTQEPLSYDPPVFISGANKRPQFNKKPGFVKIQSATQTPKPTSLYTTASTFTTPLLSNYGSNSIVYNSLVTRRPDLDENIAVADYMSISTVNSNDFDDPGYYGSSDFNKLGQPAYVSGSTESVYQVPSDDKPAFPGYYGPTPTYPPFQVPGSFQVPVEKFDSPLDEQIYTSPNDFINFPPVRNPNLNMSATSSAVTSDLELSTPAFVEDSVLKNKMNTLVHKIVESLQGNFEALVDMIDDNNNTAPVQTYQASPVTSTTVTKKPTRKPVTKVSTAKPKATTKKPITRVSTKKPAATRKPAETTTKKPVVRQTTTTSKRPNTRKPTRKVTTTTQAPAEDEIVDEEDDEDVNPSENAIFEEDTYNTGASGRKILCGMRPHVKSGRIVGGKGATFGAYPWQVLVRESTWLGLFTKNKCGGVLITNRYVITAAHCQPGFLASLVAVMGEFDISGDLESKRAVTKNVKRVIVHRQYDPATFENDIALLELESPVQFDTHIVPICMPSDVADFTGRMATVTGWGRLKYGGGVPSVLQEVQVPVIENSVCQEMFHTAGHNKKILNSFLCAGYANGQKDSCEGDSGGPLVLQRRDGRYELAGTVSHGIKCAAPYLPGVYMRTTYYKPWLRSITGVK